MFTSLLPGQALPVTATTSISAGQRLFDAVLFDRDGTLVEDVPYNGSPDKVRPMPGAREAVDRARAANLRVGVVSNQSGLARGLFSAADLARVNARVSELLGPFDTWQICPHGPGDGCACRKPAPGLVRAAAADLGTVPERCAVIGDIGADVAAAEAAGATPVLVPTPVTRPEEVAAAPVVAATLGEAVSHLLERQDRVAPAAPRRGGRVLVVRTDSAGDMLVTGPAIRAVAAGAESVVLLCGTRGQDSAALLPGVDEVVTADLPWISPDPARVDPGAMTGLVDRLAALAVDEAIVFTSFHQSALPLALLLRMAGVARVSAISDDYPGSLLDVRHRVPYGIPEPERALSLAAAAGYGLPADDQPTLRVATGPRPARRSYVVVHPGASAPARACPPDVCAAIVAALAAAGRRVLVTGGPDETDLTAYVAANHAVDLGGALTWAELAGVLAGAECLVVGNTGPAHLAAAVGTPVVSLYAPTVRFGAWAPYRVPTVRLGDAAAPCRDTRATACPVPGHPCLSTLDPAAVADAVRVLTGGPA
ncbi:HAD-IIIA family hydrolase [Asanoa sp. WMMD1127]|uniref:HAD-IIIA family hydrolase n=1 Tax=Asanoa sp. WMMD1127 TaxID=3016107 RepID=UPI002416C8A5|nr:HAD-IIIA family hydrolase [Asanoa sp. WMMD1127]MDG4825804.1 HAD-IIIA family hydrolase [Asanoa sp. WMMD1127]